MSFFLNLIPFVSCLAILLVVAECVVRKYWPQPLLLTCNKFFVDSRLPDVPLSKSTYFNNIGKKVAFNNIGLLGPDVEFPKSSNDLTIFVGGYMLWGLHDLYLPPKNSRLCIAAANHSSDGSLAFLFQKCLALHPSLIVWFYGHNDIIFNGHVENLLHLSQDTPAPISDLFNDGIVVIQRYLHVLRMLNHRERFAADVEPSELKNESFSSLVIPFFRRNLLSAITLCREWNIEFVLIAQPTNNNTSTQYRERALQLRSCAETLAKDYNVYHFDLSESVDSSPKYWQDSVNLNRLGMAKFTTALQACLTQFSKRI